MQRGQVMEWGEARSFRGTEAPPKELTDEGIFRIDGVGETGAVVEGHGEGLGTGREALVYGLREPPSLCSTSEDLAAGLGSGDARRGATGERLDSEISHQVGPCSVRPAAEATRWSNRAAAAAQLKKGITVARTDSGSNSTPGCKTSANRAATVLGSRSAK